MCDGAFCGRKFDIHSSSVNSCLSRSIPSYLSPGSNMAWSASLHVMICSLTSLHRFHHVTIRSFPCHCLLLQMSSSVHVIRHCLFRDYSSRSVRVTRWMFFGRRSDEGEVVVALNVVIVVWNMAVVKSSSHDESQCGYLTRDRKSLRFSDLLHARCRG